MMRKATFWLAVVLGAGLAVRVALALQPATTLLTKTMPDDAFYYFAIARNVASGAGVSINGIAPTNGFHPLWAAILSALFWLAPKGSAGIHLGLLAAALADVLTAWLAYRCIREAGLGEWAGVIAAALYGLHPLVIMESQNGLETAVSTFAFALATLAFLRMMQSAPTVRRWAWFGAASALAVLGRTDAIFLLLFLYGALLLRWKRQAVPGVFAAAGIFAVLMAPWIIWNLATFGTVTQSSGVAIPYVLRERAREALPAGAAALRIFLYLWPGAVKSTLVAAWLYGGFSTLAAFVGIALARFYGREVLPKSENLAFASLILPVYAAMASLAAHIFYRCYPRSWYFVPLSFSLALIAGPLLQRGLARLSERRGRRRTWATVFAVLLVMVSAVQGASAWAQGFYPWQAEFSKAAVWVREYVPVAQPVAAFNAGILGFYGKRPVINLDGVTDAQALATLEGRLLLSYANWRGASLLVDFSAYAQGMYKPFLGEQYELQPLLSLGAPHPLYGSLTIYRIAGGE